MTQDTATETLPVGMTAETATPEVETKVIPETPKFVEGQVLSVNYTVAGPVRVVWRGGKQVVVTPQASEDMLIPNGIRKKEFDAFQTFCVLYDTVLRQKDRKVPLLLKEVASILGHKAIVKSLQRKGLIDIETLSMFNEDKKTGRKESFSHAFVWPTSLGLAVRAIILEEQALMLEEESIETTPDRIEVPGAEAQSPETTSP